MEAIPAPPDAIPIPMANTDPVNPARAPALRALPRSLISRQKKAPTNAALKEIANASIPAFCIVA